MLREIIAGVTHCIPLNYVAASIRSDFDTSAIFQHIEELVAPGD